MPPSDLQDERDSLHYLRMADRHSDTTINRTLRKTAGGQRVKAAREGVGMSRPELARRLEVPYTTLASIEQGQRSVTFDTATKLSEIFDIAGEWFMGSMERQEALLIGLSRGHKGFIHEPAPTHTPVGKPPTSHRMRPRKDRET